MVFLFCLDAIAAFMDGLVSQPENQVGTSQDMQAYSQPQAQAQVQAPVANFG